MLLGRNWLEKLNLDWPTIFTMSHVLALEDVLAKYEALFEKGYGHIKLYVASIQSVWPLQDDSEPMCRCRPVPFS